MSGTAAVLVRRTHRAIRPGRPDAFGCELAAALADLHPTDSDVLVLPSVSSANLAVLRYALEPTIVGSIAIVLRRLPEEMYQSDPGPTPIQSPQPTIQPLDLARR
jgi:hypothetical protein